MKKIGIVTIIDNNNYGNRLQNYAVQEILKSKGYIVETLKNSEYSNSKERFLLRCLRYSWRDSTYSCNSNRKANFEDFNKNITFSKKKYTPYSKSSYDYVIVGSDQVWNPIFRRLSNVDLLTFVEPKKRISFAASFGISELPHEIGSNIRNELKKFKAISVREDTGKKIVEEITERTDTEVLIDPTMMIDKNEWLKVSRKPNLDLSSSYIVKYFLAKPNEKVESQIIEIAKEKKLEIVDILNSKNVAHRNFCM